MFMVLNNDMQSLLVLIVACAALVFYACMSREYEDMLAEASASGSPSHHIMVKSDEQPCMTDHLDLKCIMRCRGASRPASRPVQNGAVPPAQAYHALPYQSQPAARPHAAHHDPYMQAHPSYGHARGSYEPSYGYDGSDSYRQGPAGYAGSYGGHGSGIQPSQRPPGELTDTIVGLLSCIAILLKTGLHTYNVGWQLCQCGL